MTWKIWPCSWKNPNLLHTWERVCVKIINFIFLLPSIPSITIFLLVLASLMSEWLMLQMRLNGLLYIDLPGWQISLIRLNSLFPGTIGIGGVIWHFWIFLRGEIYCQKLGGYPRCKVPIRPHTIWDRRPLWYVGLISIMNVSTLGCQTRRH